MKKMNEIWNMEQTLIVLSEMFLFTFLFSFLPKSKLLNISTTVFVFFRHNDQKCRYKFDINNNQFSWYCIKGTTIHIRNTDRKQQTNQYECIRTTEMSGK